jgi:threonine dehydrogenase-like Zn-dependent dehydrogenase
MIRFDAPEYHADGSIHTASYTFTGSARDGWQIARRDAADVTQLPHLQLGEGYRPLRVSHCGVCATDLARRHLPFPLPQALGHEVVALDDAGAPVVVEINASHVSRGLEPGRWCPFCTADLPTHCPDRLVLGIHDLPGGFSPWLLAPVDGVIGVPPSISPMTATLIEPFAAALHAVRTVDPRNGDTIAVLGPRRLGGLVIAALASWKAVSGRSYRIVGIVRRPELAELATGLGADEVEILDAGGASTMHDVAHAVIDTTGSPAGLPLAIRLATREVHLKSTTGQPTLGLSHATELVVDEMAIVPYADARSLRSALPSPSVRTAALLGTDLPPRLEGELEAAGLRTFASPDAAALARMLTADPSVPLGAADAAVVGSSKAVDAVIRPRPDSERGLIRARGVIAVVDLGQRRDELLTAVLDKKLRISATRCGDFRGAIDLLADPQHGLASRLGARMVTDRVSASRLVDAFTLAAGRRSVKVVVTHPDGLL